MLDDRVPITAETESWAPRPPRHRRASRRHKDPVVRPINRTMAEIGRKVLLAMGLDSRSRLPVSASAQRVTPGSTRCAFAPSLNSLPTVDRHPIIRQWPAQKTLHAVSWRSGARAMDGRCSREQVLVH